jgi:hypothetical protein
MEFVRKGRDGSNPKSKLLVVLRWIYGSTKSLEEIQFFLMTLFKFTISLFFIIQRTFKARIIANTLKISMLSKWFKMLHVVVLLFFERVFLITISVLKYVWSYLYWYWYGHICWLDSLKLIVDTKCCDMNGRILCRRFVVHIICFIHIVIGM